MNRGKFDGGRDILYKTVGPAPIGMVAITIKGCEIRIASWPIDFRQPQNRPRRIGGLEHGAFGEDFLVPVFERLRRGHFVPIGKQNRSQGCLLREQSLVDRPSLSSGKSAVCRSEERRVG